ncbi:efflux RND transporter periplasmic adaptor subunit [Chryseobacterium polytrichastri]|uniref:Membrane fusion protein, cobalt-zinc-cadmium efflux system n=1 Tax=Chryseobacterium polytrichastri TaxID=1302687 RepID=A0A1M7I9X4_9FLAO|nr:efflux RND transporter periplasmic adaptor subunit [Chryseobacterium polytrichastri]SHM37520.1 membrane fusion protein, cobalt-zinc-cadmium efflux system [Chryseobacterium polytrichastri]
MENNTTKYIVAAGFLVMLAFTGCTDKKKNEEPSNQNYCISKELKKDLKLVLVERLPVEESITLTGEVESNSDKTVPFVSLVDGVVTETYFSLGNYVKKGQVLATVKSVSVNEMQDNTKTLQAQLAVAKRKLSSVESMYKDDIASQKDLQEAKSEVEILQSNISKTSKNMQLYSAGSSFIQIKSPADGYVISKNISNGMPVTAGSGELFTISNLDKVWVMANVYATNMRQVYVNQPAVVKTLAYPDENFSGKINTISQVFNENERVLKAKIIMDNNMKLRPGMSADIVLPINSQNRTALAIPAKALVFDNNQSYVIVYKKDCALEVRAVTEIAANSQHIYVEGELKAGEKIIASNGLLIYENLKNQSNNSKK